MKIKGTHHVAILSRNVPELASFYCEKFGVIARWRWPNTGIVFLDMGDTQIELVPQRNPTGAPPEFLQGVGLNHIALRVENIDQLYEELVASGVEPIEGPTSFEDVRIAFLKDLDGNIVELVQDPGP